jgi:hypothetical protein
MEEVARVVGPLDVDEPLVVPFVVGRDPALFVVGQELT